MDETMKQTGFGMQIVNGGLNWMKKAGRLRSAGRGIYVKA